jgi:hypothetical protein
MRKKLRILLLAAGVAAIVVPFGFALSNEGFDHTVVALTQTAAVPDNRLDATASPVAATATVIGLPQLPEGAKLFAIGTVLFAAAAVMRRHHH